MMPTHKNLKKLKMNNKPTIAFFGSPQIAVWVLDALEQSGMTPSLMVTNPDTPQGRKMIVTPTPVARWAEERGIKTLKVSSLNDSNVQDELKNSGCNLFIVAAYGKIIPKAILDIPEYKTINVHPSLLPKLRGASPIRSAILEDMNPTGVSIMILTSGLDEGPILSQEVVTIAQNEWPIHGNKLDELLAKKGGELLVHTIPLWTQGTLMPQEQKHEDATYSKKIMKEMGLINLEGDAFANLLKIRAFDGWPGTYFFHEKDGVKTRIKIVDAHTENGELVITRIIPEGKKEINWSDFIQN